jgi:hypothetical protein
MPYFSAEELTRNEMLNESTYETLADVWKMGRISNGRGGFTDGPVQEGDIRCRIGEMLRPPIDKEVADQAQGRQTYWITYPLDVVLEKGWWLVVTASPNRSMIGFEINVASDPITGTYSSAQRAIGVSRS